MIDLQSFCSDELFRPHLRKPFSHGQFSYATNGIFAVRVARLADIPEIDKPKVAETLDKLFEAATTATFRAIDITLPADQEQKSKEECEDCDGRGRVHEWPSCDCICDSCEGSGEVTKTDCISVAAFGQIYRLPYLRQVLQLPAVEIAELPRDYETSLPALFRFDGGLAALMVMRRAYERHLEAA